MILLPLIVNAIVICIISAELIATALGMTSADYLLVSSILSGLLTLLSFKLSKEALLHLDGAHESPDSPDQRISDDA